MSVPVTSRPRRTTAARRLSFAVPLVLLVAVGAVGGAVVAAAPAASRGWVLAVVLGAWACLVAAVLIAAVGVQRARRDAVSAHERAESLQAQWSRHEAETAHLVHVTMPAVVKRLRDGASAGEALSGNQSPSDGSLRRVLQSFATELAAGEDRAASAVAAAEAARRQEAYLAGELDRLTTQTLPSALEILRRGSSANTVLAGVECPEDERVRVLVETVVREFAVSERRASAAQAASAKALSRVQAKAVNMLADLREMQDRHGEEVFGDLLRLDHNTSQLGLMTDRLALLMGGRTSRAWNKPIGMESILRGAVGRIAAYQRVRLHCSSTAAIAGFAAEGVMHLLAELMDNAANFSPPIDEVHVYVEERTAGIVVTIEDSGLKMAAAAMRRAEESVSGRVTDLAALQGTRLGLAVVGRLAAKYDIGVNFRPSSRGGTGVVVLFPPQLLAQQRVAPHLQPHRQPVTAPAARVAEPAAQAAAPAAPAERAVEPLPQRVPQPQPAPRAETTEPRLPAQDAGSQTPGGLPVRPPGRTMASAGHERAQRPEPPARPIRPSQAGRDAGTQFGAFHRGRNASGDTAAAEPDDAPPHD
ncbi:ATP-binding protein [Streptomyces sp. 549]|uniref:ATP-binding protein n=1 Tax=Streptomyces sp. 549 TaxID=3049076 RepID=UPI0024C4002D|nr:ATP-binding protein [Streptomyces sp. 549]MDK1476667.1 ATP-binding protein [Streptomyces sp. 549]